MPDPTPKPLALVKGHRSNAEKEYREKMEKAINSDKPMQPTEEVKNNKIALKEFNRLKDLYSRIEYDDDMLSGALCRYCVLRAEELFYLGEQKKLEKQMKQLDLSVKKGEVDFLTNLELSDKLRSAYFGCDKMIMQKRKMMFGHERALLLTLSDKIRAIPKKNPETKAKSGVAAWREKRVDNK